MLTGLDAAQAKELTSFPATILGEPLGLLAFLVSLAAVHPSSRMNVHPPPPHAVVAGKKVVTGDKPELLVPAKRLVTLSLHWRSVAGCLAVVHLMVVKSLWQFFPLVPAYL